MGAQTGVSPKPRIALVLQGDSSDPGVWSGVPASLSDGFEAAGCELVQIDAEIPAGYRIARAFGMSWADRVASRFFAAAGSFVGSRRLRAAGPIDGVVILGGGCPIATDAPLVTLDDMTVVQARREGGEAYEALSDATVSSWRARQRKNYDRCRACCAASNWVADSIRDDYGVPDSKIRIVGLGHNIEMEKPDRDWAVPRFLWVGVDWERKSGAQIVEALRTVRGTHPEATLDLVGIHPQIDAEGVTGHGKLPLGSQQGQREYHDLLCRSTCFVMPSVYEPLGIAYIDAATAGIPSIGTTNGGSRDAIASNGRLVDPSDSDALLEAMLELCDPATARELGDRAYARSALYTWQAVAERVLRALEPTGVEIEGLAPFLERST